MRLRAAAGAAQSTAAGGRQFAQLRVQPLVSVQLAATAGPPAPGHQPLTLGLEAAGRAHAARHLRPGVAGGQQVERQGRGDVKLHRLGHRAAQRHGGGRGGGSGCAHLRGRQAHAVVRAELLGVEVAGAGRQGCGASRQGGRRQLASGMCPRQSHRARHSRHPGGQAGLCSRGASPGSTAMSISRFNSRQGQLAWAARSFPSRLLTPHAPAQGLGPQQGRLHCQQ